MSQSINIIYKVDKSQIDASNASVEKAKVLTDQLTQSSIKFSQQGSRANVQFGNTIEGVRLRMQQLRGQIDVTSQTDKKRLDLLVTQYKAAQKQLESYTSSLKQSNDVANKSVSSTNSLASGFGNLYSAIKLVIGAAIVKEFVGMTLESATLAGNIEAVGKAFEEQIPNSKSLLLELRKATHGTVMDLDLMQKALKFKNFGGSVESLPAILEFASVRAQQTGQSIDYMVNSIVDGIGRKSLRILDNLQISTTDIKKEMHGISMEAATVAQVSEAMGRVASRELAKMGGYAETSATKVDQLKVSWEGLKIALAQFFTDGAGGGVLSFMKDYVDSFKLLVEAQNKGISVTELLRQKRVDEAAQIGVNIIKQNEFTGVREHDLQVTKEIIAEKTHELIQAQEENKIKIAKLKELIAQRRYDIDAQKDQLLSEVKNGRISQQLLIEQIKLLKALADSLSPKKVVDEMVTIEKLEEKLKGITEEREKATSVGNTKRLDQLKIESLLLEDRILKIKDNIAWQKKWSAEDDQMSFNALKEVNDIKALNVELEKQGKELIKIDSITQAKADHTLYQLEHEDLKKINEDLKEFAKGYDDLSEKAPSVEDSVKNITEAADPDKVKLSKAITTWKEFFKRIDTEGQDAANNGMTVWDEFFTRLRLKLKDPDLRRQAKELGASIIENQITSVLSAEVTAYDIRIAKTKEYYDTQIALAGDNDKAKDQLRKQEDKKIKQLEKERNERQKKNALSSILLNTALGIVKAFATSATIYDGIVEAAFVAAEGASQYAIANRQPTGFKDGVIDLKGPGTTKSDSIPAMLSKRESVMTAEETVSSGKTLRMIRAKKLNDKVLDRILERGDNRNTSFGFDDSRLVEATNKVAKAAAGNDVVNKSGVVYEAKRESENVRRWVRSKSLN